MCAVQRWKINDFSQLKITDDNTLTRQTLETELFINLLSSKIWIEQKKWILLSLVN